MSARSSLPMPALSLSDRSRAFVGAKALCEQPPITIIIIQSPCNSLHWLDIKEWGLLRTALRPLLW